MTNPTAGWREFDLNVFPGPYGGIFNPNPSPRNGNYRLVVNLDSRNVYFTFDHYGTNPDPNAQPPASHHFYYLGRF
ncbi:hypothetical protein AB0G85_37205 [Streptomyces sioyaensis]|uniref:hypothetical protein n=1 Tax=Streptomyces sioyaensis TaxID=67364 RepID=UPI00340137ED